MDLVQMNAAVTRRQHLRDPAPAHELEKVVRNIVGLHASTPTGPFLSLFARCTRFKKEHLDHALYFEKSLGRMRCMRKTIYILPKSMMPIAHAATNQLVVNASRRYMEAQGVAYDDYVKLSARILDLLIGREMTATQIKHAVRCSLPLSAVIQLMCDDGKLVRGKPKGSWRASQTRYARFVDNFPDLTLQSLGESQACALLVEQYLRAFGPSTEKDIVWWLGIGSRKTRAALELLEKKLSRQDVHGVDGEFIALRAEDEIPLSGDSTVDHAVNLLPVLDPYLMGYVERARYLDEKHKEFVFDRSGNATSTILVDGRVVGVWDYQDNGESTVKWLVFSPITAALRYRIYELAQRVGEFIACRDTEVQECPSMVPLTKRPAGGFMSPLKESRPDVRQSR
jgi:hypothetical protein